jgi:TetR/AcrR family transcriptional regulator
MVADKENTEEKILEAAKQVFIENGSDGTRMQEIADRAGINKSLLHYYYRSKEKLFGAVFKFAFSHFAPNIISLVSNSQDDIFTLIRKFVSLYIDIVMKNPFIPMFILNEVRKKNNVFVNVIRSAGINPEAFRDRINKEIELGNIKPIDPNQLIVNVIGMCIFPVIGRPIIQVILFDDDKNEYQKFLESRKTEVAEFVINSIKTEKSKL